MVGAEIVVAYKVAHFPNLVKSCQEVSYLVAKYFCQRERHLVRQVVVASVVLVVLVLPEVIAIEQTLPF